GGGERGFRPARRRASPAVAGAVSAGAPLPPPVLSNDGALLRRVGALLRRVAVPPPPVRSASGWQRRSGHRSAATCHPPDAGSTRAAHSPGSRLTLAGSVCTDASPDGSPATEDSNTALPDRTGNTRGPQVAGNRSASRRDRPPRSSPTRPRTGCRGRLS